MKRLRFILLFSILGIGITTYSSPSSRGHELTESETTGENANIEMAEKVAVGTVFLPSSSSDAAVKQIVLIRHGEPKIRKTGKFSRHQAKQYLVAYDTVGIVIPEAGSLSFNDPDNIKVFSSPLNRAFSTARYLFGKEKELIISDDFREFETTLGDHSPNFRLPIKTWTLFARIKWILGIDRQGIESFKEAKNRARKVAERLVTACEQSNRVALVAHGFLNRYVKKELERMGWELVRDGGHGYLATNLLVKKP